MYGRWMFDRASAPVSRRSTSLRRDWTWLDRVPAENLAMKSFSCAIFLSRCALSASMRARICFLASHHVLVAAAVGDDRLVVDISDVRAHIIQEMPVMRDDDERAVVAEEELAQPVNRLEIQVVRGLVEKQRIGMTKERLGQQNAHFLVALQLCHRPLVQLAPNVEPFEQHRGVALRRVAVFFADDAFELAEAHAVLVGERRLGVQDVARLQRLP